MWHQLYREQERLKDACYSAQADLRAPVYVVGGDVFVFPEEDGLVKRFLKGTVLTTPQCLDAGVRSLRAGYELYEMSC